MANTDKGALQGRFELEHDASGPFVVVRSELGAVKVRLSPAQIKRAPSMMDADYFCDEPISLPRRQDN